MKYYFLFLYIFLQLKAIVLSETLYFYYDFGEWNSPDNWVYLKGSNLYYGWVPTANDIAQLLENEIVYNLVQPIEANMLLVGTDPVNGIGSNTTFITQYGMNMQVLGVNLNSSLIVDIQTDPKTNTNYIMNINTMINFGTLKLHNSNFYAPLTVVQNTYGYEDIRNSNYEVYALMADTQALTIANQSNINIKLFSFSDSSAYILMDSNMTFNEPQGAVVLNSSASFKTYDSNFTLYNVFEIIGENTELYIQNTVVRMYNSTNKFIINDGFITINKCNDFVSDKPFLTNGSSSTIFGIFDSNVSFLQLSKFMRESIFAVVNSTFTTQKGFFFQDNSKGSFQNSTMVIYGNFEGRQNSYFEFIDSKVSISNMKNDGNITYMGLSETSVMFFNGGNIEINCYLATFGSSILASAWSTVFVSQDAIFNDFSIVEFNDTILTVDGVFTMFDSATFVSFRSSITVENTTVFNNQSKYSFNQVDLNVNGYFVDYTQSTDNIENSFHHSNLTIYGFFTNYGAFYFNYSTLVSTGNFNNAGGFKAIESELIIENNFTNYNYVYMENSKLIVKSGSIVIGNESYFYGLNSIIEILEGQVLLSPKSTITLQNTTMVNQKGSLNINGDIIVNENGTLSNSAVFNLNSNIYLQSESGQESFTNNGELNIDHSSDSSNATNILINFINQGGSFNIGKETVMLNLNQDNSNLTMKFDNTTLSIQNDFNSTKDSITFTIGNNSSSIINVNNNANIENSTLIIRVPTDLSDDQRNTTILTFNQLNGNGFNNVRFQTYDPSTGEVKDTDSCRHQLQTSDTSMSVLLNSNDKCSGASNGKSIPTGAIIGIVLGVVCLSAVVGVILYYKTKLPKHLRLKYRLKQLNQQSQTSSVQA